MDSHSSPSQKQSVTRTALILWAPVVFAMTCLTAVGWMDNARGPIYPLLLKDLALTHFEGSLFFAVASLVAVLANFIVPLLLKKMSSLMVLVLGLLFLIAFCGTLSFSDSLGVLLIAAVNFGMALGLTMVAINIVVEDFVEAKKRRSVLSLLHSFYGLAAFLAPILIGVILSWPLSWSHSFLPALFFVVPALVFGLLLTVFFIRKHPRYDYALGHEKQVAKERLALPEQPQKLKITFYWSWILAMYVSAELYFSTRLTVLYHEAMGLSLEGARFRLSLFFLGLFVGRILNSFIPERISGRKLLWWGFMLSFLIILMSLIFQPEWIFLVGFVMSPTYPVVVSEISKNCPKDFKKVLSLSVAWSSLAVVGMHMLAGWIADVWGLKTSMQVPLWLILFALLSVSFYWPLKTSLCSNKKSLQ